ncbi:MAG: cell division protein FtsZ [Candidatus Micrarchaeia archaeon]
MEDLINSVIGEKRPHEETTLSNDRIRIQVIGVGGAGCNTVTRLTKRGIKSAETVAVNTDQLHLKITEANRRILIGEKITKGLGAGGFPEVAMRCAEVSKDKIREVVGNSELVFICTGLGGGTGTGASPVIAEVAKEQGAIVVSFVTLPFALERARIKKAVWGLEQLMKHCDSVVVIDNNRLATYVPNLPINQAFAVADEITAKAVAGISDTIIFPSLINIDYADLKAIMASSGLALISVGEGRGNDRVDMVVRNTLEHPLLDVDCSKARGALLHIEGGTQLTLGEATTIGEKITQALPEDANVIFGARLTPEAGDGVTVVAIMTGITSENIIADVQAGAEKAAKEILAGLDEIRY